MLLTSAIVSSHKDLLFDVPGSHAGLLFCRRSSSECRQTRQGNTGQVGVMDRSGLNPSIQPLNCHAAEEAALFQRDHRSPADRTPRNP